MTQNSFAGFLFKPKDVCVEVSKVSTDVGILCDRIIEGKTYYNDYAKLCFDIAENIRKMKATNIADANFCMERIANVPEGTFTKAHLGVCEKLIDLKQNRSAAICMGNPSAYVDVCRPTLENRNIPKAKDCLDAVNAARVNAVTTANVEQCKSPPGIPLRTVTPDNIIECLQGQSRSKNPNADFNAELSSGSQQ